VKKAPVVLLEFNELCPSLMTEFIEQGHLPNFKKLRDSSAIFTSEAKERAPYLEPWIQWINVHTGVPFSEHGVEHLGESEKVTQPAIWDLVSAAGMKVWICGSMNVHCTSDVTGDLLPDPWTAESMTRPAELLTYNRFIRKQVQEHSNANAKFSKLDYLKFLSFMATHGLSTYTIKTAVNQLRNERSSGKRWRRAFILDLLQFDIFSHIYRKESPMLSTFFLNSTAHMQHVYWRNMQPEVFKIKPTEKEQEQYSNAILEGYIHMDKLVERMLKTVGDDATIIFATAISQQPFLRYEDQGGKRIFRPKDIPAFAAWAGIENLKQSNPVMAEQFWLEFNTHEEVEAAAKVLEGITRRACFPRHSRGDGTLHRFRHTQRDRSGCRDLKFDQQCHHEVLRYFLPDRRPQERHAPPRRPALDSRPSHLEILKPTGRRRVHCADHPRPAGR
jgi:hypothetical protein